MLRCRRADLITFFFFCRHSSRNLKNILKKKKKVHVKLFSLILKHPSPPKLAEALTVIWPQFWLTHYRTESLYSQLNQMTLLSLPDPTAYNLKIHTFYSIKLFRHQKSPSLGQGTDNNLDCSLWERNETKRASEVKIYGRMTEILGKEPEIFSDWWKTMKTSVWWRLRKPVDSYQYFDLRDGPFQIYHYSDQKPKTQKWKLRRCLAETNKIL